MSEHQVEQAGAEPGAEGVPADDQPKHYVLPPDQRVEFDAWLAKVDEIAVARGYKGEELPDGGVKTLTQMTGDDAWMDAFLDGDTPEQAMDTDEAAA